MESKEKESTKSEESFVRLSLKTCPICKTHVFEDMDTCYNCMYSFGSNPSIEKKVEADNSSALSISSTVSSVTDLKEPALSQYLDDDCSNDYYEAYETPENCIKEYEDMLGDMLGKSACETVICDNVCVRSYSGMAHDGTICEQSTRGKTICNTSTCDTTASDRVICGEGQASALFDEFLIEFGSFLGKFLLDRKIRI